MFIWRSSYLLEIGTVTPQTPAEALATIIRMNLTVENYQSLHDMAIDKGAPDLFPSYKVIQDLKKLCLPKNIQYKDDEVVAALQDILDHQLCRLLGLNPKIVEEMIRLKSEMGATFIVYFKFGAG